MQILRDLAQYDKMFYSLPRGEVELLLGAREEVATRDMPNQVSWVTGDATPLLLAGANWGVRSFPACGLNSSWPICDVELVFRILFQSSS